MILSPRLALRRWQLKHQAVPADGRPLANAELYMLGKAAFALLDDCGSREVADDEESVVMLAQVMLAPSGNEAGE
jgi:hypothetical protein